MMEYRRLPHGTEALSVIGIGLGNIEENKTYEAISYALEHGVNFFDLCCSTTGVFREFGRAVKGRRNSVFTQMHFGAVYPDDTYGFSRDFDEIKRSFEKELDVSGLGYTDFGYVHCVDEESDLEAVLNGGLFDYMKKIAAVRKSVEQCVQIRLFNLRFDVCEKYGGMFLNDVHEHFLFFKRSERRVAVDVKFFLARLHFFFKRR